MRQQGNTLQTEEQDKTLEERSDVQIGNLSKSLEVQHNDYKDDQRNWEENGYKEQEIRSFNKELEKVKNNRTELKNTIT